MKGSGFLKKNAANKRLPVYECSNQYDGFSKQLYPVDIESVRYINFKSGQYPNGCIQISGKDAQENAYFATRLLKCYINSKGRYAIWGKHRFYEGYSGALVLRGVPEESKESLRAAAKPYGTVVE